jgi:copper(I)-binding protein
VPITLTPRTVRRTALAGATVTLSIAVTACGANFSAQTSQPYQSADGTNATSGPIEVRNMLVMASDDGKGELHSTILNMGQDDDKLLGIAAAPADAAVQTGSTETATTVKFGNVPTMTLQAGSALTLPPSTGEPITVTGGKPGQMVKVTITFSKAAPITTEIQVLTLDHYSPSPIPNNAG